MRKKKIKTYLDTLVTDKEFKKRFDREYQNLCIAKQIVEARKAAHLTFLFTYLKELHKTQIQANFKYSRPMSTFWGLAGVLRR